MTSAQTLEIFHDGILRGQLKVENRKYVASESLDKLQAHSRESIEPFYFLQAADTQLGLINRLADRESEPNWNKEMDLSRELVAACNQLSPRPKFLVVCGDLIDAEPASVRGQQVVDYKKIFAQLTPEIPLVCVCGNHDIGNQPTESAIGDYRRDFGDDYFHFVVNDVLFIVLNSQFYEHREFVEDYANEHDVWLDRILEKCKLFKYSIVFQHIPWFLREPEEEDDYFNINKDIRLKWLQKLQNAGVSKIMCGHYHQNAGGWFGPMELIITSAVGAQLGQDRSGLRVVSVSNEGIEHQYFATDNLPTQTVARCYRAISAAQAEINASSRSAHPFNRTP